VPSSETPQFLLARDQLERTRLAFVELLGVISDLDWDRPLQGEGWTVKQEMVHIVQVIKALRGAINRAVMGMGPSFLSAVPSQVRNVINGRLVVPLIARQATQESVASAYQEAHEALLATLEKLPEEAWSKGIPFPRRYRTVEELAHRPVEHFDEHAVHIRRVLMMEGDNQVKQHSISRRK
jgi:hypothetical protein